MPNWYSQHKFNKIPVLGLVPESGGTEPDSPAVGQLWVDTTAGKVKWRTPGSAWMAVDDVADGAVTDAKVAAGANIALSKLATNPLARANHTGTQAASTISDLATTVKAYRLDEFATPTADIPMGGMKLTGLAAPTNPNDSARLADVQAAQAGIDIKPSVRVATTANIALSGLLTIDGVTLVASDRVLVKNQTDATQNGLYVAASGAWARSSDTLTANTFVFVEEGSAMGDSAWMITTDGVITPGSTSIAWAQFGAGGGISAGAGLTLTGSVLDVVAADGSIVVDTDSIAVGLVSIAQGGTGATTAAGARSALGAKGSYSENLPALTAGVWADVVHELGTEDIAEPSFRDLSTGEFVRLDAKVVDADTVAVRADLPVSADTIRITVIG
ncbi:hypothetical protein ABT352_32895 [Streptosporangium sp. NPDC000563]|uniref:hypothetical protein n=1 Tax=Streptosporangium sp. NPDC000563 TaxID=3154366 RepID=UPI003333E00E